MKMTMSNDEQEIRFIKGRLGYIKRYLYNISERVGRYHELKNEEHELNKRLRHLEKVTTQRV